MRTSKPTSTISYNSQEYLILKLNELVKNKKISFWVFIFHKAEKDERKDHVHLYLRPNTLIDTMEIQDFLREIDHKNISKPLGCIDFRASKDDEWVLYTEHFEPYLASIGQSREYHYTREQFVSSDEDTFFDMYQHAHFGSEWAKRFQILRQLEDSIQPHQLILNGTFPLNMASQLRAFKDMENNANLYRGNKKTHTPKEN